MTVAECIKLLLSSQGITQRQLAERMEYSGQGAITTALSRNDGMGILFPFMVLFDCVKKNK